MKKILILQHISCEGAGSLADFFAGRGLSVEYRRFADGDPAPSRLKDYAALISLGGPMNVDEDERYPFLAEEKELLRSAIQEDFPTLGVCLGAQLIARASGASVTQGTQKEIGWFPLCLTEAGLKDTLFQGWPRQFHVFQWHQDTFEIPSGAVHLATSSLFPHQAFRLGRNVYGFQFHVEITQVMVADWIRTYKGEKLDSKKMLADSQSFMPDLKRMARALYRRLWEIWASRAISQDEATLFSPAS